MLRGIGEMDIKTFKMRQNKIVAILGSSDMERMGYHIQLPLITLLVPLYQSLVAYI